MCRIAGIIRKSKLSPDSELKAMLSSLAHGGPDDEGIFQENGVAFGHRRLAIIDLSPSGHQPMESATGEVVICFNGEIFNYLDLKAELLTLGAVFSTVTDTEVIIRAYEQWGISGFDRLRGMFAFSLLDRKNNKVFLVRDPAGIKPLYYCKDSDSLVFASEVRAFKAYDSSWRQSEEWPVFLLAFGSVPFPFTTLKDVYSLGAGKYLELDLSDFSSGIHSFKTEKRLLSIVSDGEAVMAVRDKTLAALKRHLISDAPLGVFLSGGIDSSLLTILSDKEVRDNLKAVSITFCEATFDEKEFQKEALQKTRFTKQNSYEVSESMFWEKLADIWKAMDQPSIDGVNSYFVSSYARQAGLTAVLSGLGADEYFGGYASFKRIRIAKMARMLPLKKVLAGIAGRFKEQYKRIAFLDIKGPVGDYLFLRGLHTPDVIAEVTGMDYQKVLSVISKVQIDVPSELSDKEYASFLESEIYMKNQLLKDTDFMSMWHALEVRVPFLDEDLIDAAQAVVPDVRFQARKPKYLLTTAFKEELPEKIVMRQKRGFTFPFAVWLRNSGDRLDNSLPAGGAALNIRHRFMHGDLHWSKYWSLIVMKKFQDAA